MLSLEMTRWEVLIDLIQTNGYKNIAEVGVYHGKTARHIIESCDIEQYIMIDPKLYDPLHDYATKERANGINVWYWILSSEMAATLIRGKLLDLVFLDALHDYDNIKADIAAWQPKIKPGGILCGDDYDQAHCESVKQAVDEVFGDRVELIPVGRKDCKIWVVRI